MKFEIIDFETLTPLSNLDALADAIKEGHILEPADKETLANQTETLRAIVIQPPRYRVADLSLQPSISGFSERVGNALALGLERVQEMEAINTQLGELLILCDGYKDCALAIRAAHNGLKDQVELSSVPSDELERLTEKASALEGLSSEFQARYSEILRVTAQTTRRAADVAAFIQDSQVVIAVYSRILERERQVAEASQLTNPQPATAKHLDAISAATKKVLELERELIQANENTRQKVQRIKQDHQKRLDKLNPIKALEGLTKAIGKGLESLFDGVGAVGEGLGDLGRGINKAWNDAGREIWIGLENIAREITVGLCRLQHGSPDKDKDGNGDGKNAGFYKCMDDGWHASVTVDGDGEVTNVTVRPPGLPIPISVDLITDADREAERRKIEERAEAISQFNDAVRAQFQPGSDIVFDQAFFDEITSDPGSFFKPYGAATYGLLERSTEDIEPYTDKSGKQWSSKRAYKAALTELHIERIDSALAALENDLISNEFVMAGTFFFASMAAYETAVGMVKDISSASAKGAMTLFAVTKNLASGDDVSLRLLVDVGGIPLLNTFEAWITLQTFTTDANSARQSQLETINLLKEHKKLLEDNLSDLREN